ncbi:MAG: 5'/3'-nucleotidase SurE [Actinomycetota bacterium]
MARLLLTNDDGVESPGIHAIATALHDAGHEVIVAAPLDERSGWSAGVGYMVDGHEFEIERREVPGRPDIETWGVEGPPAFCVLTAMLETFGPRPDLVVSGSNIGLNLGRGVLQSGTVGGAMIAQNFGLSAMAISQDHHGGDVLWETSGAVTVATVDWLLGAPRKTVVNVNVPNRPVDQLEGVRWARLAAFGNTSTSVAGEAPGRMRIVVTPREVQLKPDTDTHQVDEGFVTVTGLVGFRHEDDVSPTAIEAIEARL